MQNIHRFLEHTLLAPMLTYQDIDRVIEEAIAYQFIGLCVPPFWIKKAKRDLGNADVQVVAPIGFPLGYNRTETKLAEIQKALDDGADELDIVMNISAFKSGMPWVKVELAKCATLIHEHHALMKVIIETAYLNEEEIRKACLLCKDAGTDFVKTSTGFAPAGAQVEHIRLMREVLPSSVGLKASGGIKTYEQAVSMIEAGADRIGTSSSVAIVNALFDKRSK